MISIHARSVRIIGTAVLLAAGLAIPIRSMAAGNAKVVVHLLPLSWHTPTAEQRIAYQDLPMKLRAALARTHSSIIVVDAVPRVAGFPSPADSAIPFEAVTGDPASWMSDSVGTDSRTTHVALWVDLQGDPVSGIITARYAAVTSAGIPVVDETMDLKLEEVDKLVSDIADHLVVRLLSDIRIAVVDFQSVGPESLEHESYGRGLARMLGTKLSASPRLMLIEFSSSDSAIREVLKESRIPSGANPLTAARSGRQLLANYLVTGDVWSLGGSLRLDVRCVSVESRATILSTGVTIESISLKEFDRQLTEVAASMLNAIEADFTRLASRPRYAAVVGGVPVPNTPENRSITLALARTMQRKISLAGVENLRAREALADADLLPPEDTSLWALSSDRDAELVVQLQLDRQNPEAPVVDATLFDAERPRTTRSVTLRTTADGFDRVLNQLVDSLMVQQGVHPDPEFRERVASYPYYRPEQGFWMDFAIGVSNRSSGDMFLEASQGLQLRLAPNLALVRDGSWVWEPLGLRLDGFGMKRATSGSGRRVVFGFDAFMTATYHWRIARTVSPFAGPLATLFSGVVRHVRSEWQIDGRPALGLVAGITYKMASGRRVRMRVEGFSTLVRVDGRVLDGETFEGGHLGGIYVSVGSNR